MCASPEGYDRFRSEHFTEKANVPYSLVYAAAVIEFARAGSNKLLRFDLQEEIP